MPGRGLFKPVDAFESQPNISGFPVLKMMFLDHGGPEGCCIGYFTGIYDEPFQMHGQEPGKQPVLCKTTCYEKVPDRFLRITDEPDGSCRELSQVDQKPVVGLFERIKCTQLRELSVFQDERKFPEGRCKGNDLKV